MIEAPAGGVFLIEEATPEQILIPEDLSSEARLMAKTADEFVRKEVQPLADRIEAHEEGMMRRLLEQAGGLGLLAAGLPERYGGLGLSRSTLALLAEKIAIYPSFAISVGVHTGIGTLPLLYFGTPEQKRRYLPRLAAGEMIGAFALTEAQCGSDALSSQTRATLTSDGTHYRLNGTKLWITNAGFADIFTVFAKIDGKQFTAFLVERNYPGVSTGREEHKLGLCGSSTRRLILEDAQVPVENLLGEVGKGHHVALNVLNIGRFNLGVSAVGVCKEILTITARYAQEREQFGRPIARFGLIQHKLAEMAVRLFVLESMVYRTVGNWDARLSDIDTDLPDANDRYRAAAEEYAVECAIIKFFGTEVLNDVVDEGLQIHGGFGYSEEFPMARAYRDARINRIFEGTNEINRLTVLDQLLRRAQRGRLPLLEAIARLDTDIPPPAALASLVADGDSDPLAEVGEWVRNIRNATLYIIGQAREALGSALAEKQEVMAAIADMAAALYALESAWLRCRKMQVSTAGSVSIALEMAQTAVQIYGCVACAQVEQHARYGLAAFSTSDTLQGQADTIHRLLNPPLRNTMDLRRQLAASILEREGYPW